MKTNNPLVSVIVPVYNGEQYIKRCIISLTNQKYENIEIIIVDDCSIDNSPDICNELCLSDNRIKVLRLEFNQGVSHARNIGIEYSSGEYIVFVDSDDYVDNSYVSLLVKLQIEYPEYATMSMMKEFRNSIDSDTEVSENETIIVLKDYNYFATQYYYHPWACAALFEKQVLLDYNIKFCEEAKFAEDAYFVNQYILHRKGIIISTEKTYHYYIHSEGGSISRSDKKYSTQEFLSRATCIKAYDEAVGHFDKYSPEKATLLEIGFLFLSADLYLMALRARCENERQALYFEKNLKNGNLRLFRKYCQYKKHILLVYGMRYFPKLVKALLN